MWVPQMDFFRRKCSTDQFCECAAFHRSALIQELAIGPPIMPSLGCSIIRFNRFGGKGNVKGFQEMELVGTPGGIRTPDLLLRRSRALTHSIHNFFSFHSFTPLQDSAFARSVSLSRSINRVLVQFCYSARPARLQNCASTLCVRPPNNTRLSSSCSSVRYVLHCQHDTPEPEKP